VLAARARSAGACLRVARAYGCEIIDALASRRHDLWTRASGAVSAAPLTRTEAQP